MSPNSGALFLSILVATREQLTFWAQQVGTDSTHFFHFNSLGKKNSICVPILVGGTRLFCAQNSPNFVPLNGRTRRAFCACVSVFACAKLRRILSWRSLRHPNCALCVCVQSNQPARMRPSELIEFKKSRNSPKLQICTTDLVSFCNIRPILTKVRRRRRRRNQMISLL